jgi:transcriptional regulator with XRE-family HTH domain
MREVADAFAANLRRQRKLAGLSQDEVSIRASVHRTEISQLERGLRVARIDTVAKLAGALEVDPGEFVRRDHLDQRHLPAGQVCCRPAQIVVAAMGQTARRHSPGQRHVPPPSVALKPLTPTLIADWLGHADPGFTLRTYVHLPDAGLGGGLEIDAQVKPWSRPGQGTTRKPAAVDGSPETDKPLGEAQYTEQPQTAETA